MATIRQKVFEPGDMDNIQDRYGEDLLGIWVIRPEVEVNAGVWSWSDADGDTPWGSG